jgi:tRNA A37 threonylcarbamoyladenosine dehydratase
VDLAQFDYVVDCIDTVQAKLELVRRCHRLGVPIICSMGAANKLNPSGFRVADLSKTSVDPLAKVMRQTLRREGIYHVKVVFSEEIPMRPVEPNDDAQKNEKRRSIPASNAFVPPAAGLVIGGEVVKNLIGLG